MKKNLLLVAALFAGIASYAQCEAVATLNEDFSTFTGNGGLPQNCWTGSHNYPNVYVDNNNDFASVYVSNLVDTPIYLVSPELSTIDGNHQLSFSLAKQAMSPATGTVTVQLGTLAIANDFTTFQEIGTAYTAETAGNVYENITIPASSTQKFIAFKVVGNTAHMAVAIDNVVWGDAPAPACTAVATLDENFTSFTDVDENCWSTITNGAMFFMDGEENENFVTFYASMAPNTDSFLISPELTTLGGNYQLSFDTKRVVMGPPPAPGTVTIQLGTLSNNADASTFVAFGDPIAVTDAMETHANITITAAAGQKYIAFKIVGNTAHNAALIDNVVWSEIPAPVCTAVETLDENFNAFTDVDENCWSTITNGAMFFMDGEENENFVTFYASMAPNTDSFLVTPELTTLGESYELSFDAARVVMGPPPAPGTVTIQVGTLSDNTDASTFVAFGDAITVTDGLATYDNIAVTATEGQKYIAFKIVGNTAHNAALIDNVKWTAITAGIDDLNRTSFSVYPNPTADRNVTISNNLEANGTVNIYSLTGAKVFSGELAAGTQNINLSGLSAGMYIVKVESGNYSESKKLIVQ